MQWAFDVGTNWKTIDVSFQRIAHIMDGGDGLAEQQSGTQSLRRTDDFDQQLFHASPSSKN